MNQRHFLSTKLCLLLCLSLSIAHSFLAVSFSQSQDQSQVEGCVGSSYEGMMPDEYMPPEGYMQQMPEP
jgi:hypothetical protein